ncbi:hypothetical protein G7Z17_g8103 [Cylindrodendrum hubeiense]|uniref:Uncharacterized protein n=1 Tax=Cylindrodendrum hubeiense TaxID=595255 RepID=A0A9P5LEN1_9HYPO|nr:hypothetical protein G7Z17_g8103 [Cylindrodendrum hubeiense]
MRRRLPWDSRAPDHIGASPTTQRPITIFPSPSPIARRRRPSSPPPPSPLSAQPTQAETGQEIPGPGGLVVSRTSLPAHDSSINGNAQPHPSHSVPRAVRALLARRVGYLGSGLRALDSAFCVVLRSGPGHSRRWSPLVAAVVVSPPRSLAARGPWGKVLLASEVMHMHLPTSFSLSTAHARASADNLTLVCRASFPSRQFLFALLCSALRCSALRGSAPAALASLTIPPTPYIISVRSVAVISSPVISPASSTWSPPSRAGGANLESPLLCAKHCFAFDASIAFDYYYLLAPAPP